MARKYSNILNQNFKEGDVLFTKTRCSKREYIFIHIPKMGDLTYCCAALDNISNLYLEENKITYNDDVAELRYATEEERQKLIDALRKNGALVARIYLKTLGVK